MIFLLKKFRIEAEISQEELAFKSALTQSYISRLENHIEYPSPHVINHLACVLNICPHDLVDFCTSCSMSTLCNRKKCT